jgi:hypothetical protein
MPVFRSSMMCADEPMGKIADIVAYVVHGFFYSLFQPWQLEA